MLIVAATTGRRRRKTQALRIVWNLPIKRKQARATSAEVVLFVSFRTSRIDIWKKDWSILWKIFHFGLFFYICYWEVQRFSLHFFVVCAVFCRYFSFAGETPASHIFLAGKTPTSPTVIWKLKGETGKVATINRFTAYLPSTSQTATVWRTKWKYCTVKY